MLKGVNGTAAMVTIITTSLRGYEETNLGAPEVNSPGLEWFSDSLAKGNKEKR